MKKQLKWISFCSTSCSSWSFQIGAFGVLKEGRLLSFLFFLPKYRTKLAICFTKGRSKPCISWICQCVLLLIYIKPITFSSCKIETDTYILNWIIVLKMVYKICLNIFFKKFDNGLFVKLQTWIVKKSILRGANWRNNFPNRRYFVCKKFYRNVNWISIY